MKFECSCGATIHDAAERNPNKAHIVPDDALDDILDAVDKAIESPGTCPEAREADCMAIRSMFSRLTRLVWQCRDCFSLHVDTRGATVNQFSPETKTSRVDVLRKPS